MTSEACIAELDIAIAEREAFLRNGAPTRHPMADPTLGRFIGFVSYDTSGEPVPPEWTAVFRYAASDIKMDRRATRYEYDRRPKGELEPPRKAAGEILEKQGDTAQSVGRQ